MTYESRQTRWNEPMRMALLGVLSIAVVIGIRVMFSWSTSADHSGISSRSLADMQRRTDDIADAQRALSQRLDALQSAVEILKREVAKKDAKESASAVLTVPQPSIVTGMSGVKDTLKRGWAYVAKGEYD